MSISEVLLMNNASTMNVLTKAESSNNSDAEGQARLMGHSVAAQHASSEPSVWHDFQQILAENGSHTAVIDDRGNSLTRHQMHDLANSYAEDMRAHGLVAGDVVLICMPNWTEWVAVYLATQKLGLVPGTLPVTSEQGTVSYVANLVGAKAVFLPKEHRGRSFADELETLQKESETELLVMLVAGNQVDRDWVKIGSGEVRKPVYPTGLAHILFSSSTTGKSKAIAHSERSMRAYNTGIIDRYGVTGAQSIFMPSPMGHSTGVWHGARMSIITGATLVLQDLWDPQVALELVDRHNCAITVAATPFLIDLVSADWNKETPKLQSMHTFLCGGAPIPPSLIEAAQKQMPKTHICSVWAMSEGGATSSLQHDDVNRVAHTSGKPLPDTDLKIVVDGETKPAGTEGELVMKTGSLFLSYLNQEDLYSESFTTDGYFRTGDVGVIDADGYLQITGRLKDLIIRGGVNIPPVEIENALASHPAIAKVAVIGEPDERLGEKICAVVQEKPGEEANFEEIIAWLKERNVARRLWPESLKVVDQLPETPAGKVRKNILREQLFKTN